MKTAAVVSPNEKRPTTHRNQDQNQSQIKNQNKPQSRQTQSSPLPSSDKATSAHPVRQNVSQASEKKVSFPAQLTRGRGTTYTPASPGKRVRFDPTLAQTEEEEYKERRILGAEYRDEQLEKPLSQQEQAKNKMDHDSGARSHSPGKDVWSDSDDSFIDVVTPVTTSGANLSYYCLSPKPHRKYHRGAATGFDQPELGETESYINQSRYAHRRDRHSFSEYDPLRGYQAHYLPYATATTGGTLLNRYSRSHSVPSSIFNESVRHGWPQPVFVNKAKNMTVNAGRPGPLFVSRTDSDANKNASKSKLKGIIRKQKENRSKYQPAMVSDETSDRESEGSI